MTIERIYIVPLRKGFIETARHKKTKKAVSTLKIFLSRHMKQDDMKKILIGKNLNEELWKHGIKNPPHHVKINVIKEDDGTVKAELIGFKYSHKKKDNKDDAKTDDKKEDKKTEEKAESKLEKTGEKKEVHKHDDSDGHMHGHDVEVSDEIKKEIKKPEQKKALAPKSKTSKKQEE